MSDASRFLTIDLGAESGRAVLGVLDQGRVALHEVHRFANEPQRILERFHWDTVRLFADIKTGIARCCAEHGPAIDGMGVDTWGVDFVLLDDHDDLLGLPYHYRDRRTDGMMDEVFAVVPRSEIYETTGIQFMQLNTLYQLMALRRRNPALLDAARSFLMTPDILNFWLTGRKANEFTNATTTQFYDPRAGGWATTMLERLGIPSGFLGEVVQPGTVLAPLHGVVCSETNASAIPVIEPATHDTGSAVAAVPAEGDSGWAYISCGTWSLVGLETPAPVINATSLEYNLTNEGGVCGTTRLLRNVMGLWLLQQCRRSWLRDGSEYTYEELASVAAQAPAFASLVDPDNDAFLHPTDMPTAIREYCSATGQRAPEDVADMVRCIVESLAMKYRWVIERLEAVTGTSIHTVHVIGGGCRNRLLCQATADATGKRVLAGPVEATALGNIIIQGMAVGAISSLAEGRRIIGRSFPLVEYQPIDTDSWHGPYQRFAGLLG